MNTVMLLFNLLNAFLRIMCNISFQPVQNLLKLHRNNKIMFYSAKSLVSTLLTGGFVEISYIHDTVIFMLYLTYYVLSDDMYISITYNYNLNYKL